MYTRYANRVGASRLFNLSRALDVPVFYFFEDTFQRPRQAVLGGGPGP